MKPENNFIFDSKRKKILEKLSSYYGIKELPFLLSESGKEKIRGYTGFLSYEEIATLNEKIGIELLGMYLITEYPGDLSIRLSFDAVHALKNQITKNIIDLADSQAQEFLKGRDILLSNEEQEALKNKNEMPGFKIMRNKGEFLGSGKLTTEGRIVNYMPKERRLR